MVTSVSGPGRALLELKYVLIDYLGCSMAGGVRQQR